MNFFSRFFNKNPTSQKDKPEKLPLPSSLGKAGPRPLETGNEEPSPNIIAKRDHKYEINLKIHTLGLHLVKRTDPIVFKWKRDQDELPAERFKLSVKTMKSLKKVRRADIQFFQRQLEFDPNWKHLSESLRRLTSLQSLTLDFSCCRSLIRDESLKNLAVSLQRLRSLQSLNLQFRRCSKITPKGLKTLSEALKRLGSLRSISLNFTRSRMTDQGLNILTGGLKRLSSLQFLNLKFNFCPQITDQGLKTLSECLKRLTSLQSIHFTGAGNRITDESLKYLDESLKGLSSLRSIHFAFSSESLTSQSVETLNRDFKKLANLKTIKIENYKPTYCCIF